VDVTDVSGRDVKGSERLLSHWRGGEVVEVVIIISLSVGRGTDVGLLRGGVTSPTPTNLLRASPLYRDKGRRREVAGVVNRTTISGAHAAGHGSGGHAAHSSLRHGVCGGGGSGGQGWLCGGQGLVPLVIYHSRFDDLISSDPVLLALRPNVGELIK